MKRLPFTYLSILLYQNLYFEPKNNSSALASTAATTSYSWWFLQPMLNFRAGKEKSWSRSLMSASPKTTAYGLGEIAL